MVIFQRGADMGPRVDGDLLSCSNFQLLFLFVSGTHLIWFICICPSNLI
jgi:hypothetical protein